MCPECLPFSAPFKGIENGSFRELLCLIYFNTCERLAESGIFSAPLKVPLSVFLKATLKLPLSILLSRHAKIGTFCRAKKRIEIGNFTTTFHELIIFSISGVGLRVESTRQQLNLATRVDALFRRKVGYISRPKYLLRPRALEYYLL